MNPVLAVVATVAAAAGLVAAGPKVTLQAPTHSPKITTHWVYTVTVTNGGKPEAATITAQIVDPIGGKHAVELGKSTQKVVNLKVNGRFSDFIVWPASSRGIPLTFRVTVRSDGTTKVLNYSVTPH